jgi:Ca2+-binding RTX toxin-like protein
MLALLLVVLVAGTPGPDVLTGGPGRDVVHAGRGDDRVAARGGSDWLDGGLGDDVLYGGVGRDFVYGGPGDDRLIGGGDADLLRAGAGNDVVDAREPRPARHLLDCIACDPIPPGADLVIAGAGDDRVLSLDRHVDAIHCGSGYDVVVADPLDRLVRRNEPAACEVVLRG